MVTLSFHRTNLPDRGEIWVKANCETGRRTQAAESLPYTKISPRWVSSDDLTPEPSFIFPLPHAPPLSYIPNINFSIFSQTHQLWGSTTAFCFSPPQTLHTCIHFDTPHNLPGSRFPINQVNISSLSSHSKYLASGIESAIFNTTFLDC